MACVAVVAVALDVVASIVVGRRVSVRSVGVGVSRTGVVGATPTVISAAPRPDWPSTPMTK